MKQLESQFQKDDLIEQSARMIFMPVPSDHDDKTYVAEKVATQPSSIQEKVIHPEVLKYWKKVFLIPKPFIEVVASSLGYWECAVEGERELFFFLSEVTSQSYRIEEGTDNPYAPCNADLNSVRASMQVLAASGATFDPVLSTAYSEVRLDKDTGRYILRVGTTYKGKILFAKANGLIKDVWVGLVYSKDRFEWRGKDSMPVHIYDPFSPISERGNLVAGYAVTVLAEQQSMSHLVMASELEALLDMSLHKNIVSNWKQKMLAKCVVNQAEQTWHYFIAPEKESDEKVHRNKASGVRARLQPFLNVYQLNTQREKVVNAVSYGASFFQSEQSMLREAESMLMAVYANEGLAQTTSYSIATIIMALDKYGLSISSGKDQVYAYASSEKGGIRTAQMGVMYKGFREIAFNQTFKSLLPPVDKIDYQVVRQNDKFVFQGRYKKPTFESGPISNRGEIIGGYVVAHRGQGHIVTCVSKEIMDRVSDCSRNDALRVKWPEKYAIKTIL